MRQQVFKIWESTIMERWYWHLVSGNGKIICAGQPIGYATKRSALKGIEAIRRGAADARIVIE